MAEFTEEQVKKFEMLTGLGLPEEMAKKCAAADAEDYETVSSKRSHAYSSLKIKDGVDLDDVKKHLWAYSTSARACKGVLEASCAISEDVRVIELMEVLSSPDALDALISNCFLHYANTLSYCDPKSLEIIVICDASEVEYYKNRLSIFGASKLQIKPTSDFCVGSEKKQKREHHRDGGELREETETETEAEAGAGAEAEAGPSRSRRPETENNIAASSQAHLGQTVHQQPSDADAVNGNTSREEREEEGDGDGDEDGDGVARCPHAEQQVLEVPLTRRLILRHKVELERDIRTNENIRKAVKEWLEDPVVAEKWYSHISDWDVSRVTDMSELFRVNGTTNPHLDVDLSRWQVGNVTNMSRMFDGASSFTSDLSGWQTDNVVDMSWMFNGASSFTGNLGGWQTGNVTNMSHMFNGALAFTSDLSRWETGNVRDMSGMFAGASCFNSDLSQWQTGNATNMSGMFHVALSFKSDLSKWDTRNVKNMRMMFTGAVSLKEKPAWFTG